MIGLLALLLAARASPTPAPTPTPFGTLSRSGVLRAYDFQRYNRVGVNQSATNFGGSLHLEYTASSRPFTLGATYFFANPLGTNGSDPRSDPQVDNTLPGYSYSSLGELFAQYRTWRDFVQLGKMQIATPWANGADGRLIPVTFQGLVARRYFGRGWNLGLVRVARFKSRTSATFDADNLLTTARTSGFLMLSLSRAAGSFTGSLHQYWFDNIASLTYAQASWKLSHRRFIGAQGVIENDAGAALLGVIHNRTLGLQFGQRIGAVTATLGYDEAPAVLYLTSTPSSIFQPTGGTAAFANAGGGLFRVVGGGIASPYTDGYVADPLFTTSIVTSLVDRRSPGSALELAFEASDASGRLSGRIARSFFDFSNPLGSASATESALDAT
ncbi:MAG TPA: OprD family outer membrane porin, partial [Candidatus Dormibacteraeota bacterium]|nr:OprD family outer membrane porin [Candidatus Dormibacteraeota bacterium]